MKRQTILTLLLIAFQISFSVYGQTINFDKPTVSRDIIQLIQKTNSVGTSVIITNADSIIYFEGFGKADLEKNLFVNEQTLFGLGSITKTFTALGILKLVENGKLNLTDKVLDLAPELPITNKWEEDFPVRIFHLLEHTTGFDELHPKDKTIPVISDDFPLKEGISIVKNSLITRWEPGSRFAYSNVGYLVAGYIIEKISGTNYNDFIKSEVLEDLKMNQSALKYDDINHDLLAKSYSSNKKPLPFKYVFTRPTASLYSSATDMSKFIQMMLNKGKTVQTDFLNETNFNELESHHSLKLFLNTENGYRLGIFPRFYNGIKWYGHGGSFNQYNSEFEYCHELGVGIFVVANGPNATRTVDGILEILHNQFEVTPKNKSENSQSENPESFEGFFILTSPRNQILYPFTELFNSGLFISSRDNKLFVSGIENPERRLYMTGDNKFSSSQQNIGYQYIFDESNETFYTSLGFSYERKSVFLMVVLGCILIISIAFILLSQLIMFIRVILTFMNKKNRAVGTQTLLELSASILLIGVVTFLLSSSLTNIHEPNATSVILFLATLIFPILTIIGTVHLIKGGLRNRSVFSKTYLLGLTTSLIFMASYLYYWDLLAFKIWSY